jgi:hypothetical protein
MTWQEWLRIGATINRIWPHQPVPPPTVEEWFRFVAGHDADEVCRAIDACAIEGAAFPPPIGRVLQKVVELREHDQLWGEVKSELRRNIARFGSYHDPDDIVWSSPDVRDLVEQVGWLDLCTTPDTPTFEAQCREKWLAIRARRRDDAVYAAMPDSALRHSRRRTATSRLEPVRRLLPLKVVSAETEPRQS